MIKVDDIEVQNINDLKEVDIIADRQKQLIDRVYQKAEKRYNELEETYNVTGNGRTANTMYWWNDIMRVCRLAEYAIKADCPKCTDRKRDIKNLIHKYRSRSQTDSTIKIQDVINDLEEFLRWYK
jgi:hypothetical protein